MAEFELPTVADGVPVVTLKEYAKLEPFTQGYVVYWQAEWPGSELKGQKNPYPERSSDHHQWNAGQQRAVQHAQDSEE